MVRRVRLITALAGATSLLLLSATSAGADTTLGSISVPSGSTPGTCEGAVIAETQSDPSTPYTVPSAGTITSWRVAGLGSPGTPITLVVLKNTGGLNYSVVGADTHTVPNPVTDVLSFTVGSPIAVSGGEILGVYEPDNHFVCYFHDGATPLTDALIALETPSTPSAGQSLLESDASGGGFRLNLEATLTPPPAGATGQRAAALKKCKRKAKKKHWTKKKLRKCKKKAKKLPV